MMRPKILIIIGIRECEIIQWFVEPEARVEEFDKICEVQSDKASVEIPSRFSGVIKRLHYEAGEMAIVGKPLIDIDVHEDVLETVKEVEPTAISIEKSEVTAPYNSSQKITHTSSNTSQETGTSDTRSPLVNKGKLATLATPAVRHLSKELDVDIADVIGTGRDGRVSKDDVYQFAKSRDLGISATSYSKASADIRQSPTQQTETIVQLGAIQSQMFKTMSRSLTIPHFLYADEIDVSALFHLRQRLNASLAKSLSDDQFTKLTILPFIIKAMSLSLDKYPILNARVDIDPSTSKPLLVMRSQHNIGIAMDTPQGLLVPVIKNVAAQSILSIASELRRLQAHASKGSLSSGDLSGGTITLSNIGNIGGTYVSPVIVDKEVAILGIGKMRTIPAFNAAGQIVKKQICNFSWSADHRVVNGATMAKAAEVVRGFVEEPDMMMVHLR
jgi:2-oxoisovalerate dehydrogenase E2 component (dihydrolipoyl transacylase)